MAKPTSFSARKELRITKVNTLEMLEKAYNQYGQKKTLNTIMNDALEIGLKSIIEENVPQNALENLIYNATQRVIMNQNRSTKKMVFELKKIAILQTVSELFLSSIIQELEFYFQASGVKIDDSVKQKFLQEIPARFEKEKQDYIEQIMGSIDDDGNA